MNTTVPNKKNIQTQWHSFISSSRWSWFWKILVFTIFSLVINHLSTRENFPDSEHYRFPMEGFIFSMALCILIAIIADVNFNYYRRKYFSKKIEFGSIVWFMVSTLGYITILYIPLCVFINLVAGGSTEFYYLLIGLLLTLLVSFIGIGLAYAQEVYQLYKLSMKDAEIIIESGAKTTKLTYENIACFYSDNKVVYAVQNDGTTITTDFTLNALEEKINDQLFLRANRQIIIHKDAVAQIEKIENGKLLVRLKPLIDHDAMAQITISRYKRKAFMEWYQ